MDPATKSGMRTFYEPVHSVEVLDPQTVQVRLKHPYAFFLHMLAAYRTGLILYSPTATQKYTIEDRKQGKAAAVVGCGPFRLVEWVKGSHLVMDRFDKYFVPGLPYLDRVQIRTIKDPVTEMAAFKAGEVDFIASFSPEHVDTIRAQNPKAQIMTGKETTPMLAAMKVTIPKDGKPLSKERIPHPIFGDLRVRKAVGCYGIDRKEIVKIAFKGQATPWLGMNPPGTLDTVDVNHMCPYDQAKAKALLGRGGIRSAEAAHLRADDQHREVGLQHHCHRDQGADGAHRRDRQHPAGGQGHLDEHHHPGRPLGHVRRGSAIPDHPGQQCLPVRGVGTPNASTWTSVRHTDTKVDDYYARYARELDPVKRKAIAKELVEYVADKMYWNVVSGSPFFMVAQPWMKDYVYNAEFEVHYHKVWLDK